MLLAGNNHLGIAVNTITFNDLLPLLLQAVNALTFEDDSEHDISVQQWSICCDKVNGGALLSSTEDSTSDNARTSEMEATRAGAARCSSGVSRQLFPALKPSSNDAHNRIAPEAVRVVCLPAVEEEDMGLIMVRKLQAAQV